MGKQRLSDGVDVHYGEYAISGTTVIDSSRNLTNIGTITASGDIAIDTDTLFVDVSTDRVGINTSAPDHALDVAGNIGLNEYIYHNGDHNTYFRFQGDQITLRTGGTDRLYLSSSGVQVNNAYTLPTADGSANQVMQTDGSGTVSFATLSSSFNGGTITADLTLNSSDPTLILNDTSGTTNQARLWLRESADYGAQLQYNSNSNDFFQINMVDGGTSTGALFINRNGNIGIGSAPGVLLDVHKDSTSGQVAEYRNDTGYFIHRTYADYNNDGTTVEFQTRVGGDGNYSSIGNYSNNDFFIRTNNTDRLKFNSDGIDVRNSGTLKMGGTVAIDASRNLTNIGTISSGAISSSGTITAGSGGSVSAPIITFSGDTDTGIYRVAANQLAFTTAGTQALRFDASQNATFAGYLQAGSDIRMTGSSGNIRSDNIFQFLTISGGAQNIRTKSVFAGSTYGDTPPAGSVNATNTYELNGTTVIDSSRNLTNIGTISATSLTVNGSTTAMNSTTTNINSSNIVVGNNTSDDVVIGGSTTDGAIRVTNGVRGFAKNYADSSGWVKDTNGFGSQTGYYGGNFSSNGSDSEQSMDYGTAPDGSQALIWTATGDTTNDGDGGWNKTIHGVRDDTTYMSVTYIKRNGSSTSGSFYHGCSGSNTLNIADGSANTNPYFIATGLSNLPQDVWCVSIGYIRANNNTSTAQDAIGGVYRCDTGERILDATTYKMKDGSTEQQHRTYLYYSTTGTSSLSWFKPGFYEVNGSEPTLRDLVNPGMNQGTTFNGDLVVSGTSTSANYVGTGSYHEFGNSTGSVSNDGSWNARLNLAGSGHARLDVKSVSDGIIGAIYAHTGHAAARFGTLSAHNLQFMYSGTPYIHMDSNGNLDLTTNSDTGDNFVHLPRGGGISFYGDNSGQHSITSRNQSGTATDDILIGSYGAVYIDLDSNDNNTSGADFIIGRHSATNQNIFIVNGERSYVGSYPQIRAVGWYGSQGSSATGPAAEIGVSASRAHLIGYDRDSSAYIATTIAGSNIILDPRSSYVNITGSGAELQMDGTKHLTGTHDLGNISKFYLSNNFSGTYVNASGNYFQIQTASGYTQIGANNTTYSHFVTDRGRFYFNKRLQVNEGIIQSHDEDLQLRRTNSSNDRINIGDTVIQFFLDGSEDMRLTNTGNLDVEGDVTAYSTVVASDERLKDVVVTIENAVEKVSKLRGVEFIWNKGKREGKQDIGVIAQEVEKVLPEVVIEKELPLMEEGTTYKTVDYPKLTAVLIEAIKEQQKEIEQLKKHSHPAKDMCDMKGYEELVARIEKMEKNYGNN
jgi:hypothetical protein